MIEITDELSLDEKDIQYRFVGASGPGGQKVNKTSCAVQLRFDIMGSPALPEDVRTRLLMLAGKRVTEDGILIIEASRYRTQEQNRQDALDRLVELVREAVEQPKPRLKTKPTAASKRRRLEEKKRQSQKKQLRRKSQDIDE